MSEISPVSGTTTTTSSQGNELSGAMGQETFLNLLTVQLQHQDPLDPMSNEAFVEQLATFSTLEELVNMNATLEAVYLGIASMNNAAMANLVGTQVVARGDTFAFDGEATVNTLHFDAGEATTTTTVNITDSDGHVVYTEEIGPMEEGEGQWIWDGKTTAGDMAPEGDYTFAFTGTDDAGADVTMTSLLKGIVDEMDYSSGTPQPSVNGTQVDIADIIRLTLAAEGSEGSSVES